MDQGPFAVSAHPDRDRLHGRAAAGAAVAGGLVHVKGPEAMRAVVAVPGAVLLRHDRPPAMAAVEGPVFARARVAWRLAPGAASARWRPDMGLFVKIGIQGEILA